MAQAQSPNGLAAPLRQTMGVETGPQTMIPESPFMSQMQMTNRIPNVAGPGIRGPMQVQGLAQPRSSRRFGYYGNPLAQSALLGPPMLGPPIMGPPVLGPPMYNPMSYMSPPNYSPYGMSAYDPYGMSGYDAYGMSGYDPYGMSGYDPYGMVGMY